MSRFQSTLIGLACCVTMSLAFMSSASAACKPDPGRQPIRVSVGGDGKPVVSPEEVRACVGETIRWVFNGWAAKQFAVEFTSAEDSPFDWAKQTGATVEGTIRTDAVKGDKPTGYDYNVSFDSQASDPRIIVDP
jgi:plastocyanin